jgi:glycosyltransferase involved in cell wall biosynthesis
LETVDILLPAYNPLPGWEDTVIQRFKSLQQHLPGHKMNLVIVNDGSGKLLQDAVNKVSTAIQPFTWVEYPVNRGKGYALREGVRHADSSIIVYTDIDWPYEETSMISMIRLLSSDADVVIGIRDEAYYKHLPPARKKISRLLRKINAKVLRLKVDDTQAGLKGFRNGVKEHFLKTTINRYLFDLEFIYLLSSIPEIHMVSLPIRLREGISFSTMNKKILFQEMGNFLKIWFQKMWS